MSYFTLPQVTNDQVEPYTIKHYRVVMHTLHSDLILLAKPVEVTNDHIKARVFFTEFAFLICRYYCTCPRAQCHKAFISLIYKYS